MPQMRFGKIDDLGSRVTVAIDAARKYLFSEQHEEGYWCGELEADTTLESDYILLHTLARHWQPGTLCQGSPPHSESSERRWRLEHLRRGAVEYQRVGEGLFRT